MAIFKSQKHAFWQALVVALIFFNLGIFFGYMLEKNRINKIDAFYAESELNFLDIKAMSDILNMGIGCNEAIQSNMNFANKIYEESRVLQDYEDASRLSEALTLRHKRYDLLRTQLWINNMVLRKKCAGSYHTVVYLYQYANGKPEIQIDEEQDVLSRLLGEVKSRQGDNILLIPIAADSGFESINMLTQTYNITKLPTVLVDESIKLETIDEVRDIEKYLK